MSALFFLAFGAVVFPSSLAAEITNNEGVLVEVVLSSKLLRNNKHQLQVLWDTRKWRQNDTVRLVDTDKRTIIFYNAQVTKASDFLDTGVAYNAKINYTAQYLRGNTTVLASSSMQKLNNWMSQMRETLSSLRLYELLLPGTHNSAAYSIPGSRINVGPFALYNEYVFTQDETVGDQLKRGARYLDIRVGYYPSNHSKLSDQFWTNHDFIKIYPLQKTLNEVKKFINESNEIVIMDFHHFPVGFNNPKVHRMLGNYLKEELGELMYNQTSAWDEQIDSLWKSNRRLIVSYNRRTIASEFSFFPPVRQLWGDVQTLPNLYKYIDEKGPLFWACTPTGMTAAMVELTPTATGVLTGQYDGLRSLAHDVNADLSIAMLNTPCWVDRFQAIAVDFLSSTTVVKAAIMSNKRRADSVDSVGSTESCKLGCDIRKKKLE